MEQPSSPDPGVWPPKASPIHSDEPDDNPGAAERSLVEDFRALVQDTRLLAEAEIDFQKKRVGYGARAGKTIVVLFAAAAGAAFFAAMALVVGLVIALGTVITIWGSTALVTLALLAAAGLLASRALAKMRKLKATLAADADRKSTEGQP